MKRSILGCLTVAALLAFAGCSKSPDELLADGQNALRSLDSTATIDTLLLTRAIKSQETFLAKHASDPRADSALFMLASLQNLVGQRDKAAVSYLSILQTHPNSRFRAKSLILAGQAYEGMLDYDRARACYQRLIREFPAHDFVVGGSAQWLIDNMGMPSDQWSVPFADDTAKVAPPPPPAVQATGRTAS